MITSYSKFSESAVCLAKEFHFLGIIFETFEAAFFYPLLGWIFVVVLQTDICKTRLSKIKDKIVWSKIFYWQLLWIFRQVMPIFHPTVVVFSRPKRFQWWSKIESSNRPPLKQNSVSHGLWLIIRSGFSGCKTVLVLNHCPQSHSHVNTTIISLQEGTLPAISIVIFTYLFVYSLIPQTETDVTWGEIRWSTFEVCWNTSDIAMKMTILNYEIFKWVCYTFVKRCICNQKNSIKFCKSL